MYSTYPTLSKTITLAATAPPTYDELVTALRLIEHATAPTHDDGAYHEAAHDLATQVLKRLPEDDRTPEERSQRAALGL